MKRASAFVLILVIGLFASLANAQDTLTNDAIVKLVKAGLSDELIVGTINSQPGSYKIGVDDIVALKKQGVSDRIVQAMMKRNGAGMASPTESGTSLPAGYPNEIGVYIKKKDQWVEIQPEVINWKTGGVFKSIASAGIVKGDVNGHLNGEHSPNNIDTPLEFCIYAPEGVAITEYQLIHLRDHKESREFRTVTGGVMHTSGGATRDLMQFDGKKVASRTFVVTLINVTTGEYGFLPPGAFMAASSASSLGKMYTFHVVE